MTVFFAKYKNIFIAIVIAVVVFFLYTRFFSSSDNDSNSLLIAGSSGGTAQESVVGKEFLTVLLELRSIELDTSLFEDRAFLILKDFSQEVSPQPSGRPNPFLEIGNDPTPPVLPDIPDEGDEADVIDDGL